MPKRTNPRQQIIELLVSMNAGPGCTVTPSKSLRDVPSGLDREVDVVVERLIDRETSTWSYEVVAPRRPADVEWVEAMIAKHDYLPTEKLFLVSWSGFTRGARRQAATNPRVELGTPDLVPGPNGPRIKTIRVGSIRMTPTETRIGFNRPDGSKGWIRSEPDIGIYLPNMMPVGPAQKFTEMLLHDPRVGPLARENASAYPERDDLKSFDLYAPIENGVLNLYEEVLDELQPITLIEVLGDFRFAEKRLDLEVRELRGQPFAYGTVELAGADATLVTRLNEALDITAAIGRFEPTKPKGEK
jgi:hypothetical protein